MAKMSQTRKGQDGIKRGYNVPLTPQRKQWIRELVISKLAHGYPVDEAYLKEHPEIYSLARKKKEELDVHRKGNN